MSNDVPWPPPQLDPATVAIREMTGASRQLVGRMARLMAMNPTDMSAISALAQNGPMGATELADHLGIRTASATVMIDRLERAGHVERVRDTADRRRVTVTQTPAALAAEYAAWSPVIERIDEICRSLPDDHRAVVVDVVDRVTAAIRASGH